MRKNTESELPSRWIDNCPICSAAFTVKRDAYLRGNNRFCGRDCYGISKRVDRIHQVCDQCSKPFEALRSEVSRGNGRFCSPRCMYDNPSTRFSRPIEKRIMKGVTVNESGCWILPKSRYRERYGRIWNEGKQVSTHRVAWEIASGEKIPKSLFVCHTCDNMQCVKNDEPGIYVIRGISRPRYGHLWLGTPADNSHDRDDKGRYKNKWIKLSESRQ